MAAEETNWGGPRPQSGGSYVQGDAGSPVRDAVFDRVPPHDDEAEMAVLGGMLLSKDAIGEVSQMIDVTDFYQPKHQTIYEAIIDLFSNSQNVDVVIVANQLMKDGNLDKVGGADYLHTLVAFVPTAANATYYAEIVHQRAILRNVIAAGTKIAQLGYSAEGSQAEDVVNLAQAEVYEMSTGRVKQDYEAIGPVVHDALEQLDKLQNGDQKTGVPTGFRDIDDVTQGLQPGQMVVVAGRPAMGKSTLGIDFARAADASQYDVDRVLAGDEQGGACAAHHLRRDQHSARGDAPRRRHHRRPVEHAQQFLEQVAERAAVHR